MKSFLGFLMSSTVHKTFKLQLTETQSSPKSHSNSSFCYFIKQNTYLITFNCTRYNFAVLYVSCMHLLLANLFNVEELSLINKANKFCSIVTFFVIGYICSKPIWPRLYFCLTTSLNAASI